MSEDGDSDYAHHDLEIEYLNPDNIEIDSVNERRHGAGAKTELGDLEKSIREEGIQKPPQVRPKEDGEGYKVFAGQRRVLAAQAVEEVDEIPVIVKDFDDMQALAASVNENNEYLNKDVTRKDRALAIKDLQQEWDRGKIADRFGVSKQTVKNWLEVTQPFWEGTIFDPQNESDIDTESLPNNILPRIRTLTQDKDEAEDIARELIEDNVPTRVIEEALDEASDPASFRKRLRKSKKKIGEGGEQIRPRITLSGEEVNELREWARERGVDEDEAVKQLTVRALEDNVYTIEVSGEVEEGLEEICENSGISERGCIEKIIEEWQQHKSTFGMDPLDIEEQLDSDD